MQISQNSTVSGQQYISDMRIRMYALLFWAVLPAMAYLLLQIIPTPQISLQGFASNLLGQIYQMDGDIIYTPGRGSGTGLHFLTREGNKIQIDFATVPDLRTSGNLGTQTIKSVHAEMLRTGTSYNRQLNYWPISFAVDQGYILTREESVALFNQSERFRSGFLVFIVTALIGFLGTGYLYIKVMPRSIHERIANPNEVLALNGGLQSEMLTAIFGIFAIFFGWLWISSAKGNGWLIGFIPTSLGFLFLLWLTLMNSPWSRWYGGPSLVLTKDEIIGLCDSNLNRVSLAWDQVDHITSKVVLEGRGRRMYIHVYKKTFANDPEFYLARGSFGMSNTELSTNLCLRLSAYNASQEPNRKPPNS